MQILAIDSKNRNSDHCPAENYSSESLKSLGLFFYQIQNDTFAETLNLII